MFSLLYKWVSMLLCMSLATGIVWWLLVTRLHENNRPGGFRRHFAPAPLRLLRQVAIGDHEHYLAGQTSTHVYLGDKTVQNRLLQLDADLTHPFTYSIVLHRDSLAWMGIALSVDSPVIYLREPITGSFLRGSLSPLVLSRVPGARIPFTRSVPLFPSSMVLTTYDTVLKRDVLAKWQEGVPELLKAPDLLQRQLDGRFCEDGMLLASPSKQWLVYVYYYRNQFVLLDSSLHLLGEHSTIDTNATAQIRLDTNAIDRSVTIAASSLAINTQAWLTDDRLYIYSAVRADNERVEVFTRSSVVDVYALPGGAYQFSFYVPHVGGSPMTSFRLRDSLVTAAYRKPWVAQFLLSE